MVSTHHAAAPLLARARASFERDRGLWLVVLAALVVRAIAIGWGLPGSDGWDDDGVAPRDFLVGVVETYSPGDHATYPPVHLILLSLLTAPGWIAALARAPSHAPSDVIHEMIRVPYMTWFSLVARVVSLGMSLGIVVSIARIAEEVRGKRAGVWAAAACAVNAPLTYYAHTSNLDVPYLFWAVLSILALVRAIARGEPRRLRAAFLFAALAVGTKDQAYALFLLAYPAVIAAWIAVERPRARAILREVAIAAGLAAALLLVVDGAVTNPSGFRARVRFLLGTASQDHAYYANDWSGRLLVIEDTLRNFTRYYPVAFAPLVVGGVALPALERDTPRARRLASLLPFLAAVSFTLTFNCTARRTEHRFLLPQMVLVAVYAGTAIEALVSAASRRVRPWVASVAVAPLFAWGLFGCLAVDASLLGDPRYDAERWLAEHVAPGDVIEVYGNNVYLPRFPAAARVVRVDPGPVDGRSPLPGVTEVQGVYDQAPARAPRFIVLSQGWVWRYMLEVAPVNESGGRVMSPVQQELARDGASQAFFPALDRGERGYVKAHVSSYASAIFPPVDIHASTTREIRIFERRP
jgi:4-amino-4-deoxy-L-arabinose transferase-like glycosyltransferase